MSDYPADIDRRRPKSGSGIPEHEEGLTDRAVIVSLLARPDPWLLQRYLERATRRARLGPVGALLLLDVERRDDRETLPSHSPSDPPLFAVAQRLQAVLRVSDFLVRLEDNEFAVVLQATSLEEATTIAERLLAELRALQESPLASAIDLAVSVGLAPIDGSLDADAVCALAREALARAKEGGGNCLVVGDSRAA